MVYIIFRHVSSNDKTGKRYRETKPVFSIEDDEEDAGIIVLYTYCSFSMTSKRNLPTLHSYNQCTTGDKLAIPHMW